MDGINEEELERKIEAGETLTEEEQKHVMSSGFSSEDEDGDKPEEEEDDNPSEQVDLDKSTGIKKDGSEPDKKDAAEKTEDSPSEKAGKTDEPEKKESEKAKGEDEISPERKAAIEKEAEKSLTEANLEDYSARERALFFDLRKERRKRQEAQQERDVLKFQKVKDELKKELGIKEGSAKSAEMDAAIQKLMEGKEDDDLLTVADLKEALKNSGTVKTEKAESGKEEKDETGPAKVNSLVMKNWMLEGVVEYGRDFTKVVELSEELLSGDKEAIKEVQEAIKRGENAAIVTFKLVKSHAKFPELAKKLGIKTGAADDKGDTNAGGDKKLHEERKKRIEDNAKKTVTTGTGGGSAPQGEYTLKELLEMPDDDFGQLPADKREKILAMF